MLTAYRIFFSLLLCIFFVCFWCFPFHSKLPLLGNWPLGKPLSRWILKLSSASLVPGDNFYNKMLKMNLLKLCCWKDIRYCYCWYPDKEMSQASLVLEDNFYKNMLRMMRDAEYRILDTEHDVFLVVMLVVLWGAMRLMIESCGLQMQTGPWRGIWTEMRFLAKIWGEMRELGE